MGGQVELLFDQLAASTAPHQVREAEGVAVTIGDRASVLPEVPTMVESGSKEMDVINITGLLAPTGTPPEIVARLNAAVPKVFVRPEVKERFATLGVSPLGSTPEEFADVHPRRLRQVDQGDHRCEYQGRVTIDRVARCRSPSS